jgi:hypothetical protein
MSEQSKAVRKFRRAAEQRWLTARWLFDQSTFHLDAMYLGGYAVECSLKALILKRTPASGFEAVYVEITAGKKAHDFEFLKALLRRKPISIAIPKAVMESFQQVATWSTDLRYESGQIEYDEAKTS